MNCLRCNTSNGDEAKFCKSCGMNLNYVPVPEKGYTNQTINQVLLLMGIGYLFNICYFILEKAILPVYFKDDYDKITLIYEYFGWTSDIIYLLILILFTIIIKNKNARIWLVIFIIVRIVFLLGYRVF